MRRSVAVLPLSAVLEEHPTVSSSSVSSEEEDEADEKDKAEAGGSLGRLPPLMGRGGLVDPETAPVSGETMH